jgi:hypothetical protein
MPSTVLTGVNSKRSIVRRMLTAMAIFENQGQALARGYVSET